MIFVLLAAGVALLIFGAVILIRYADRPGGSVKWLGMELTSTGAGLPLIALGIGCLVFAVTHQPGADAPRPETTADSRAEATPEKPAPTDCFAAITTELAKDRIATIENGMRDVHVIEPPQSLTLPFALFFTDEGQRVGAARVRSYGTENAGAKLYKIEKIVDAACREVSELRNVSRGGDPTALTNWDTVRMRFGEQAYEMRIGGDGDIEVNRFSRSAD